MAPNYRKILSFIVSALRIVAIIAGVLLAAAFLYTIFAFFGSFIYYFFIKKSH